jgi:hypothetical protein
MRTRTHRMNRGVLCVARVTAEWMKFRTVFTALVRLGCPGWGRAVRVRPVCFLLFRFHLACSPEIEPSAMRVPDASRVRRSS